MNDIRLDGVSDLQATFWIKATHIPTGIAVVSDRIGGDMDKAILILEGE
jgi:hypothetical protein